MKSDLHTLTFSIINNSLKKKLLSPFYKWGNQSIKLLNTLLKITPLELGYKPGLFVSCSMKEQYWTNPVLDETSMQV